MKAYVVDSANGPFREVEMPTPMPVEGQVLVRIRGNGINPLDTKIRALARTILLFLTLGVFDSSGRESILLIQYW